MEFKKGDRISLCKMPDDPDPISPGTKGYIVGVNPVPSGGFVQYQVKWDDGRTLMIVIPPDEAEKIG